MKHLVAYFAGFNSFVFLIQYLTLTQRGGKKLRNATIILEENRGGGLWKKLVFVMQSIHLTLLGVEK